MKIGLDFDGVLVDSARDKVHAIQELYGITVTPAQCKGILLTGAGILTREQYREVQVLVVTERYASDMQPVDGCIANIAALKMHGHEMVVITSRDEERFRMAQNWLKANNVELPAIGVGYQNSKALAAKGLDIFVDDDLDKLQEMEGVVSHRFLFGWGYNRHEQDSGVKRIESWAALFDAIESIEHDKEVKLSATCKGCGFSGHPSEFPPAFSPYHDLRCPKCSTTNINWNYGSYKDNTLTLT